MELLQKDSKRKTERELFWSKQEADNILRASCSLDNYLHPGLSSKSSKQLRKKYTMAESASVAIIERVYRRRYEENAISLGGEQNAIDQAHSKLLL